MKAKVEECIRAIRAHPRYKTLRNLTILFLYVVVGCAVYGELEGWNIATTLSFIVVTVTTVGYGYHTPGDDNSRLFTIFYIIFGLCFVFAMVMGFLQNQISLLSNALAKNLMQTSAEKIGADYQKNRRMVIYNLIAIALTVLFGGVVLMYMEDWSFIQGVYFALCTSSVGVYVWYVMCMCLICKDMYMVYNNITLS
ncbi:two pore domain potassium channel family protein, partial [archaeon]